MTLGGFADKVLSWLVYDALYLLFPPYKRKSVDLISCSSLLGDLLMVTTVAREIKKRNPGAHIRVRGSMPELFNNNPDVSEFIPRPRKTRYFQRLFFMVRNGYGFPWKRHVLHYCCKAYGIRTGIELKSYIYPSNEDYAWATRVVEKFKGKKVILISREAGTSHYRDKKRWPADHWGILIEKLIKEYVVMDVGKSALRRFSFEDENWTDWIDQTSIHQLAALMEKSHLLIGPPSGLVHLASHCALKTLVIAGGSEPGTATQYPNAEFLDNLPPCHNCFLGPPCDKNIQCMRDISPERVYGKILSILGKENSVADFRVSD